MVKNSTKAKKAKAGRTNRPTTKTVSGVTTIPRSESSGSSLPGTSQCMGLSSLVDLSNRVTQVLSTAYGISADRSLPLTTEILEWSVDGQTFESDASIFIKSLAQPKTRLWEPKALNLHNALEVVFDQQQEMDSKDVDHCWRTVVAGLILVSSGRLSGTEQPRSDEELQIWLAQTQLNIDAALRNLDIEPREDSVMKLTYQVLQLLAKWEHLVPSLNPTDLSKMAVALKNHLQGRRVNPKDYWSQRRFTYGDHEDQIPNRLEGVYTAWHHGG